MRDPMSFADGGSSTVLPTVDRADVWCRNPIKFEVDWALSARRDLEASRPGNAAGLRAVAIDGSRLDPARSRQSAQSLAVENRQPSANAAPSDGDIGATGFTHLNSFNAWKYFVHDNFPWLELRNRDDAAFGAAVTLYRIGGSLFSTLRVDACEAIRSRHLAEASRTGYIKLIWQLSGRTDVEQDGRSVGLEAGQIGLCDTSRLYRMHLRNHASLAVLLLPSDAFPGWRQMSPRVCGRSIGQSIATGAALAALMSLNGLPEDVVASEGGPVLDAVKWMLSNTLRGEPAAGEGESPCGALIAKAKRHIVEHIANPRLGPDHVASALCMSRRSLYLLFKGHRLSPSKMIHDIRLNQAKRSLEDPGQAHQKLTNIAFDAGFADYATFSRLFKLHFGVTPSEFRSCRRLALCA